MPSSVDKSHTLAALCDNGRRLVVEFSKTRDRFAHRICWVDGERSQELLESVEGREEDWPPSPPLQQLSESVCENGQRALLLVGMAGRSHWSLSVHAEGNSIVFDAACRIAQPPAWLGSTYQVLDDAGAADIVHVETGLKTLNADRVSIDAQVTETRWPATIRWRYRLSAGAEPAR